MTSRSRAALVLAAGAAVVMLGLAGEWVTYGPNGYLANRVDTTYPWVLDLVTGYAMLGSGLVATIRRPGSLVGPLFILAGTAWFAGTLIEPPRYVGTAMLPSVVFLYRGFLAHAILAFPTGRPAGRVEWSAIVLIYAASLFAPLGYSALPDLALVGLLVAVAWRGARRARGSTKPARGEAFHAAVLLALATAIVTAAGALDVGGPPGEALTIGFHVALMAVVIRLGLRLIGSTRPELTDLVVELGAGARATMRGELARLLDDDTVRVGTWSAERDAYLDGGTVLAGPVLAAGEVDLRIDRDGAPLAIVRHQRGTLDDPDVTRAVMDAVRLSVANSRLRDEVETQVAELAASRRRLIVAGDTEGERLGRRLREGALRHLETVEADLGSAATAARASRSAAVAATSRALDRLASARQDLYDFGLGLDPRHVVILGLKTSLEDLARDCPVPVDIRASVDGVPQHVAVEAYLVCAEALANVAKHARATAVRVEVRQLEDGLVLTVTDDGVGGARFDDGSGLRGLADRAESLGGAFALHSDPGRGTRLVATLPLPVVATSQPSATSVETRTDESTNPLVITDALATGGS